MDYIQGEKFIQLANSTNIFYSRTELVNDFFDNLPTKDPFILISHNGDGKVTYAPSQYDADINKIPPNLVKWYAQNVCDTHEKIQSIPIGLENNYNFPDLYKISKMLDILKTNKSHTNMLYMNHNINTNLTERSKPYELFEHVSWCTSRKGLNGDEFDDYLYNLYNHKFVISPEGNGPDTHRLWECLYLNTIPIEKRNINNQFYIDLPICFVDAWEDITEEFLHSEYNRITNTKYNMNMLSFSYWADIICKPIT
jgi:hypothetical protein